MDNDNKRTDPDYKPTGGQETNENWDDNNDRQEENTEAKKSNARIIDEQTNTTGAASSQRADTGNVGPLDADLAQLPSEKRLDRGNLTGSGLG